MRGVLRTSPALAAIISVAPAVQAHEDPEDRIHELTHAIEAHPDDAAARLERARLYRVEGHWESALADLDCALVLKPALAPSLQALRSEALLGAGRAADALTAADACLAVEAVNVPARLTRARSLVALERHDEAIVAYTQTIELLSTPPPDCYLERARAAAAAGRPALALEGLEEGVERLGPVVAIEMAAVDLECALGRHNDALARVARLNDRANRKEQWLLLRGEILDDAGRGPEAADAYFAALKAIEQLPAAVRNSALAQDAERKARSRFFLRISNVCDPLP